MLQEDSFAGPRGGDDQGALAAAQRRQEIHHAGCDRLMTGLQPQPLFGVDRREFVERFDFGVVVRDEAVDVEQLLEAGSLAAAMALDHAVEHHALTKAKFLDHRAGHKRIGPLAGEGGGAFRENAVSVGVHLQHAGAGDQRQRFAVFRVVEFLPLLAVGGDSAGATSSAAPAAPASTRPASAHASLTRLPTAVSTAAAFLFAHVIQHLKQELMTVRPLQTVSTEPRAMINRSAATYELIQADTDLVPAKTRHCQATMPGDSRRRFPLMRRTPRPRSTNRTNPMEFPLRAARSTSVRTRSAAPTLRRPRSVPDSRFGNLSSLDRPAKRAHQRAASKRRQKRSPRVKLSSQTSISAGL